MNCADFHKLAAIRIKEARVLLDRKCYQGAYYLAGYAVECALKACIAKLTQGDDFPPKPDVVRSLYQHDLASLLNRADLKSALESREQAMIQFKLNWAVVKDWSGQKRYDHQIDAKR